MANTKRRVACYTRVPTEIATTETGEVVKLSPNRKYWVDCIQEEFDSIADAARAYGIASANICRSLGGRDIQCAGMYWRYID